MHAYDDKTRHAGMLYVLMIVIAVAFGGFLWQLYSAPEIPRIPAPAGPYKVEPPPEAPPSVQAVEATPAPADPSAAAEEELPPPAVVDLNPQPETGAMPRFVANGPYVAQLAALQSEAAVDNAWRRFASRAPDLFSNAHMDVERADLGARGVYHRVRAGYFADRANASLFCERIRQMGQDCIVAAR
jgi:hypothetical protein